MSLENIYHSTSNVFLDWLSTMMYGAAYKSHENLTMEHSIDSERGEVKTMLVGIVLLCCCLSGR